MDLSKQSSEDLCGYLGVPVKLELNMNGQPICGNVYTIDPETRSVVLMQFDGSNGDALNKLVWIPGILHISTFDSTFISGSSIKLMHELSDNELLAGCVPCSSKHLDQAQALIQSTVAPKQSAEDDTSVDERLQRLTDFLSSKNVPFTFEDQIIKVGPVQIERPYREENFKSKNLNALQRTQKMLASVL